MNRIAVLRLGAWKSNWLRSNCNTFIPMGRKWHKCEQS